jgi:hypothetical protein
MLRQQYLDWCRDDILPEHSDSLTIGVPYDALLIYREDRIR